MSPEILAATIRSVADAIAEGFRFLQTDLGQSQVEVWLNDQARFRKDWEPVGKWLKEVFKKK